MHGSLPALFLVLHLPKQSTMLFLELLRHLFHRLLRPQLLLLHQHGIVVLLLVRLLFELDALGPDHLCRPLILGLNQDVQVLFSFGGF